MPHSVTNITGDNNAVANGGNATSTQSTSTNMDCSSGPGGTGVPATQSQKQTQGQQGQTTNSQTNSWHHGRPVRLGQLHQQQKQVTGNYSMDWKEIVVGLLGIGLPALGWMLRTV